MHDCVLQTDTMPVDNSPTTEIDGWSATLHGWAMREMAPWRLRGVNRIDAERFCEKLNVEHSWAAAYRFANGDASLVPRGDGRARAPGHERRAELYSNFFKEVARILPPAFETTILVNLDDQCWEDFEFPIFCFQKRRGAVNPLVPDIDFLGGAFYEGPLFSDQLLYRDKSSTAVFTGGTSGGLITEAVARTLSLPRLRAANFFQDSDRVDFRLPAITQAAVPAARKILENMPFCCKPRVEWPEQLRHKFIISMDGNGATCSRVVVALRSNSVLLKYDSDEVLYYFGALQPWVHYVPVTTDSDVEAIMDMELLDPEFFRAIAESGRRFASTYLSRVAVYEYTKALLTFYANSLSGAQPRSFPQSDAPLRDRAGETLALAIAHLPGFGDVPPDREGWAGRRGSGRPMEGFSMTAPVDLAHHISYQAVLENGDLGPLTRVGEYCGTKGKGQPIFGFLVRLDDAAAGDLEAVYEAQFLDGQKVGPISGPELCRAPSNAPVEAFRVGLRSKVQRAQP